MRAPRSRLRPAGRQDPGDRRRQEATMELFNPTRYFSSPCTRGTDLLAAALKTRPAVIGHRMPTKLTAWADVARHRRGPGPTGSTATEIPEPTRRCRRRRDSGNGLKTTHLDPPRRPSRRPDRLRGHTVWHRLDAGRDGQPEHPPGQRRSAGHAAPRRDGATSNTEYVVQGLTGADFPVDRHGANLGLHRTDAVGQHGPARSHEWNLAGNRAPFRPQRTTSRFLPTSPAAVTRSSHSGSECQDAVGAGAACRANPLDRFRGEHPPDLWRKLNCTPESLTVTAELSADRGNGGRR
jgi:hypothetical protein